ncbi:YigZ family protein [Clostridia bacterium]|nr:YigZ family protein [Clostridia bacterium]
MDAVKVPLKDAEFTLVEKRSKFIGRIFVVSDENSALSRLAEVRARHRDATHNVYAYRILENNLTRYSDDGEPSGTAGMPVLDVLARPNISNALCVVTRYFGGTLLGTGGLVRAYAAAAKGVLEAAGVSELVEVATGAATVPYPLWEQVQQLVEFPENIEYGESVKLVFRVKNAEKEDFAARVVDLTHGRVCVEWLGVRLGVL